MVTVASECVCVYVCVCVCVCEGERERARESVVRGCVRETATEGEGLAMVTVASAEGTSVGVMVNVE